MLIRGTINNASPELSRNIQIRRVDMKTEYYKTNSDKSKEPEKEGVSKSKKIGKVVEGEVEVSQKKGMGRVAKALLPEGGFEEAKNHIVFDVLIPTIRKLIFDTVETIIYPAGSDRRSTTGSNSVSRASYDKYYSGISNTRRVAEPISTRRALESPITSFEDVIIKLESRGQALNVLEYMREVIEEYECVSIGDLYEMLDIEAKHTDWDYGWMDLRGSGVTALSRGGFRLELPRPRKLPVAVI